MHKFPKLMHQHNQTGITLLEVILATLLSSLVFALIISLSNKIQDVYKNQQVHLSRQVALSGVWDLMKSIKKVTSPYVSIVNTPTFTEYLPFSAKNNIVLTSNAYEIAYPLNSHVVSSAATGLSNVDKPSDQLVIQYQVERIGQQDCEGRSISPANVSADTVIEKYYVRKSADAKTLVLACTAGRYSTTTGFSDMSGLGRVIIPNVDYFHFMLISLNSDRSEPNFQPTSNLATEWHNLATFLSLPATTNSFGRQVIGVELGILMHSNLPSGVKPPDAQPTTREVMDETVVLNNPSSVTNSIYDLTIQPVMMGYGNNGK